MNEQWISLVVVVGLIYDRDGKDEVVAEWLNDDTVDGSATLW